MKSKTGKPFSEAAKLIAQLFRRKLTTHWSEKEIIAFKKLEKMGCFETLDDLKLATAYTEAERKKGDKGIHRRDLLTFLNRFPGEMDRANAWALKFPGLAPKAAPTTKEQPKRWREFILKVYPQANPDFNFWIAPQTLRDEYREWEKQ